MTQGNTTVTNDWSSTGEIRVDEKVWDHCTDPEWMLSLVRGASSRKMRLVPVGILRSLSVLRRPVIETVCIVLERHADGEATAEELCWVNRPIHSSIVALTSEDPNWYAEYSVRYFRRSDLAAAVIRDLFRNPYRTKPFDPAWRTAETVSIARKMYESRCFTAMPSLANALADAGCNDPDMLLHCHSPGSHVRGCWAVDLVLGLS